MLTQVASKKKKKKPRESSGKIHALEGITECTSYWARPLFSRVLQRSDGVSPASWLMEPHPALLAARLWTGHTSCLNVSKDLAACVHVCGDDCKEHARRQGSGYTRCSLATQWVLRSIKRPTTNTHDSTGGAHRHWAEQNKPNCTSCGSLLHKFHNKQH